MLIVVAVPIYCLYRPREMSGSILLLPEDCGFKVRLRLTLDA